jgi:hypothetical protein
MPRPLWILMLILGFMFWWPVGLAILFFSLWSGQMGCGGRWQHKMARMQDKMERMRGRMEGRGGYDFWGAPRSSGNHAFDEYRNETLRRLEDEQREFKDFLERLRFAKDKTEFDAFMAERRNRPAPPAPSDQPQG